MHILVDIRHLAAPFPSGVGLYTTSLLRALSHIDQHNQYFLFSSGKTKPPLETWLDAEVRDRFTPVHLPIPNKLFNLRTLLIQHPTLNWHVKEPIDLLFLPNLAVTTLPTDIPSVLTVHDLSWHLFPELYSKKMQWWHRAVRPRSLMTRTTQFITPSSSTARDLTNQFGISPDRIETIAHGVEPLFTPSREARDHGIRSRYKLPKRFALFVGTLEPRKNLLALLDGIKLYRTLTRDDVHLVCVGKWGWQSTSLRHRLQKRDVRSWVHLLGYVPDEDRPALYRWAEVFVWPSLYEGFGLPVLESMASGTPVITSHTSSLPELTHNAALLIDPTNITELADALKQLLSSQPLQQQLKARGIARASQFSWEHTAKRTLEVFERQHTRTAPGVCRNTGC